jgi:hypothetical protein
VGRRNRISSKLPISVPLSYLCLMTITTRTLNICCFKQNLFTFDHSYVNIVVFVIIFMLDMYVSIAEKFVSH